MTDKVEIRIGSKVIGRFLEYEADSNVLVPADEFSCRTGKLTPEEAAAVKGGVEFGLYVNGAQEMQGIIDVAKKTHSKDSLSLTLTGRDFGGLIEDFSVTRYETIHRKNIRTLALDLLKEMPFLKRERIIFGKGVKTRAAFKKSQYCPGTSVFQTLADYCQRAGLIFWLEPDGTVIFDRLAISGPVEYSFYLYSDEKLSHKNNVLSVDEEDNLSKRYSQVTVAGQVQGEDGMDVGSHSRKATARDKTFPFYKPLVLAAEVHEGSVASQAEHEIKKRIAEGYRITVVAKGHSQGAKNFRANRKAYLVDAEMKIDGEFLVLGRKFTLDKASGPRTILTLGLPMEGYAAS